MAGDKDNKMRIQPRIRYNTIGGVNGPLVILENVRIAGTTLAEQSAELILGQISSIQRDCVVDVTRWRGQEWAGT